MAKMMSFDELLELIAEDPITGAREAQKRNEGVRLYNYQSSVSAGALYRRLKDDLSLISAFYQLPFWSDDDGETRRKKNHKYLNKHCHQYIYKATTSREMKRAEDHAFATQSYLDDDTTSLKKLFEALVKGGFDGLKKAAPAQAARSATRAVDKPAQASLHEAHDDDGHDDDDDCPLVRRLVDSAAGGAPPAATTPKMPKKKVFEHLLVAMRPDELSKFLPANSEVGDRYLISVERVADDSSGMSVWQARDITQE